MAHRRTGTAAAALLLLLLLSLLLWLALRRLDPPAAPAVRPVTSPVAVIGSPVLLAWEGGGPPFRVSLSRGSGELLWRSQRTSRPLVRVPEEVLSRLAAGEEYRWYVEGVDARGHRLRSDSFPLTLVPIAG